MTHFQDSGSVFMSSSVPRSLHHLPRVLLLSPDFSVYHLLLSLRQSLGPFNTSLKCYCSLKTSLFMTFSFLFVSPLGPSPPPLSATALSRLLCLSPSPFSSSVPWALHHLPRVLLLSPDFSVYDLLLSLRQSLGPFTTSLVCYCSLQTSLFITFSFLFVSPLGPSPPPLSATALSRLLCL